MEEVDHVSGSTTYRPGRDRVMAAASGHHVDLIEHLQKRRIEFVALDQPFTLNDHVGQLMIMILSWVAEFELAQTRERIHDGLARARAEGKRLGRPRTWAHEEILDTYRTVGTLAGAAPALGCSTATVRRSVRLG